MKIQLVLPQHDAGEGITTQSCFPPLGILSIATHLRVKYPLLEIEVIDCEITDSDDAKDWLNADVVGIHSTFLTHRHAIKIAELAKNSGAFVLLGGPHPSAVPEAILKNRPYVDAVVVGDGENAVVAIIEGKDYSDIPNLVYRKNNKIIQNPISELSVKDWKLIDFSFVNLNAYWLNWKHNFPAKGYSKPLPFISQRGCRWRLLRGACIFCSNFDTSLRSVDPHFFWEQIRNLHVKWGADYVRDNSDDRAADNKWLSDVCATRPKDIDVGLRFYCRASSIDINTVQMLRYLNVVDVFVGFESGDTRILNLSNKGTSRKTNVRAAKLLHDNGINVLASFLLGLPGEDRQSVSATVDHIQEIRETACVNSPSCTIMIPFPGSPAFNKMLEVPDIRTKYKSCDLISCEDLRRDWISRFTHVDYEELIDVVDSLFNSSMVGSRIGFGPGADSR